MKNLNIYLTIITFGLTCFSNPSFSQEIEDSMDNPYYHNAEDSTPSNFPYYRFFPLDHKFSFQLFCGQNILGSRFTPYGTGADHYYFGRLNPMIFDYTRMLSHLDNTIAYYRVSGTGYDYSYDKINPKRDSHLKQSNCTTGNFGGTASIDKLEYVYSQMTEITLDHQNNNNSYRKDHGQSFSSPNYPKGRNNYNDSKGNYNGKAPRNTENNYAQPATNTNPGSWRSYNVTRSSSNVNSRLSK